MNSTILLLTITLGDDTGQSRSNILHIRQKQIQKIRLCSYSRFQENHILSATLPNRTMFFVYFKPKGELCNGRISPKKSDKEIVVSQSMSTMKLNEHMGNVQL